MITQETFNLNPEAFDELLTLPAYVSLIEEIDKDIALTESALLDATDPAETLRLTRYWQCIKRIRETLVSQPSAIAQRLKEERERANPETLGLLQRFPYLRG